MKISTRSGLPSTSASHIRTAEVGVERRWARSGGRYPQGNLIAHIPQSAHPIGRGAAPVYGVEVSWAEVFVSCSRRQHAADDEQDFAGEAARLSGAEEEFISTPISAMISAKAGDRNLALHR